MHNCTTIKDKCINIFNSNILIEQRSDGNVLNNIEQRNNFDLMTPYDVFKALLKSCYFTLD
jgi:hypothetical protein